MLRGGSPAAAAKQQTHLVAWRKGDVGAHSKLQQRVITGRCFLHDAQPQECGQC